MEERYTLLQQFAVAENKFTLKVETNILFLAFANIFLSPRMFTMYVTTQMQASGDLLKAPLFFTFNTKPKQR